MKRIALFLAVLAFAAALPAGAQIRQDFVFESIAFKVKPGDAPRWEATYKRFLAWKHQHKYPFDSVAFMVVTGKNTGQYWVGIEGPHWSDFGRMDKFDASIGIEKEIQATFAPDTESIERAFYVLEPDLSVTPETEHTPRPLVRGVSFSLKPGGLPIIKNLIRQMNVAIKKAHWPGGRFGWFELAEGNGPQLRGETGFQDWADFQSPTPSLRAVLVKVYGETRADALLREFNEQLQSVSSQVLRYRPDLSYTATKPQKRGSSGDVKSTSDGS